jgi:hypothetical protein
VRNERRVLERVLLMAKESYEKYPTSRDEDLEILAKDEGEQLTFN